MTSQKASRFGWRLALAGAAVILMSPMMACRAAAEGGAADAGPGGRVVPVTVVPAETKNVQISLDGLGSVAGYYTVNVRARVDGQITQVLFKEGQVVRQGDVLVRIDPRPFWIQLHQAQGALARDEATLKTAEVNLERYKDLAAQKLVPQQQVDNQAALVGQARGTVLVDKAAVESAQLNLAYATVVSPIDGVTGVRQIDPGNIVHASDANAMVVLTQLDPISVFVTLPQDDLPAIAEEMQKGPLTVDVFSRDGSTPLGTGTVLLIDNQINATTGTLRLKVTVPNPKRRLWPNQFVKAQLRLKTLPGALVIPAAGVQRGPEGTFAYVIGSDQTASPRPLQVSLIQGDQAVIASGLSAGDQVVTEGQSQLRAGAKVKPRVAGQAAPEGPAAPQHPQGPAAPQHPRSGHTQGNKVTPDSGRSE